MTRCLLAAVLIGLAAAHAATAGDVLDRVHRDGVVRCTAEERPAVAEYRPDGGIGGIAVDVCRAVAIAVLGRDGRVEFSVAGSAEDADVAFVSADGAAGHALLATGPTIFVDRLSVLVPMNSHVRAIDDLGGETVCLMIGSPEQSALEAAVVRLRIDIVRLAFEEDDEMRDAYAVGRCDAMAGTETELAELRGPMGINRLVSRIVPVPLALVPVVAATGKRDRDWSAIAFWVARTIVGTEAGTPPPAGVRPGWREDFGASFSGSKTMP